jgi:hypothetical protein
MRGLLMTHHSNSVNHCKEEKYIQVTKQAITEKIASQFKGNIRDS